MVPLRRFENMNTRFDKVVRFRAPAGLKARLDAVAGRRMKKSHEVAREALVEFVAAEEVRLGLPPVMAEGVPGGAR